MLVFSLLSIESEEAMNDKKLSDIKKQLDTIALHAKKSKEAPKVVHKEAPKATKVVKKTAPKPVMKPLEDYLYRFY